MRFALLLQIVLSVTRFFAKMGTCCSEFDGESYEAAGNLRNHSRWCSGCQIPERNNLQAPNLIHTRIPLCWYNEEIGVPFQTFVLHARSPGISNILNQISGLLMSWVHRFRWIQEDFSSDESSDVNQPPGVTLIGRCTMLHWEHGCVVRPS